jgi:hypothetical protein
MLTTPHSLIGSRGKNSLISRRISRKENGKNLCGIMLLVSLLHAPSKGKIRIILLPTTISAYAALDIPCETCETRNRSNKYSPRIVALCIVVCRTVEKEAHIQNLTAEARISYMSFNILETHFKGVLVEDRTIKQMSTTKWMQCINLCAEAPGWCTI